MASESDILEIIACIAHGNSMKRLRRIVLLTTFFVSLACIIHLLNFTAPNPTGRRYSSEHVITVGQFQDIGQSGEQVVATDLGQPLNNIRGEYQCLCKSNGATPPDCNICSTTTVPLDRQETYRVPDFVTANYIAEVKNTRDFNDPRIFPQIEDYANAAITLGIPLWVYARIDTEPDQNIRTIVQNTGGDVIFYLTSEGYVDLVDQLAINILIVMILMIILLMYWELRSHPYQPKSPVPKSKNNPMDSLDTADSFLHKTREKVRQDIDKSSTRIDIDQDNL